MNSAIPLALKKQGTYPSHADELYGIFAVVIGMGLAMILLAFMYGM